MSARRRSRTLDCEIPGHYRRLAIEPLEERRLLSGSATQKLADLPASEQAAISAVIGRGEPAYRAVTGSGSVALRNAANGFSAQMQGGTLNITAGSDSWSMTLVAAGYDGALASKSSPQIVSSDNRVDCNYPGVDAWYVNGPAGLEQGFTVAPPASVAASSLTLHLALGGTLRAAANATGTGLSLTRPDGTSALSYNGLSAADSTGRALPVSLEVREDSGTQHLLVDVNTAGAIGAVTIDPFIQVAILATSDPQQSAQMGYSIAISGDTLVAGAPNFWRHINIAQGAAYVFVKPVAGWSAATVPTAELFAADGADGDQFGASVAIDGDTIVIGAPRNKDIGNEWAGAAYVFVKPPHGWAGTLTESAKLIASDAGNSLGSAGLGTAVAVSGENVFAGAPGAYDAGLDATGAAYVFRKPATGWKGVRTESAKLLPSDEASTFGTSLAISGNTLVIGNALGTFDARPGGVYVFIKPANGWFGHLTENARLTASDGRMVDQFGYSVATDGDSVVVGAPLASRAEAYVFTKPVTGWTGELTQTARLYGSNTSYGYGVSVAVNGSVVLVSGDAAYFFIRPESSWPATETESEKIVSPYASSLELYTSVALSSSEAFVGAPAASLNETYEAGAVLIYGMSKAVLPAVSSLTPAFGPSGGNTSVTITGTNLNGATSVMFGKSKATIVNDTATQIVVKSPPGTPGDIDITVTTALGTSVITAADQFTYQGANPPAIKALGRTAGGVAGGNSVAIRGQNFTGATTVYFGTKNATIVGRTATTLTVISPPGTAGPVDVRVVTPQGTSPKVPADVFTYLALPVVAALSPAIGPKGGGTTVAITGQNLSGATAVYFGTKLATIVSNTGTKLIVKSPAGAVGAVDVTVTTLAGRSALVSADRFSYLPTPAAAPLTATPSPAMFVTALTAVLEDLDSAKKRR